MITTAMLVVFSVWIGIGLLWLSWAGPVVYREAKRNHRLTQFFALVPTAVVFWPLDMLISILCYLFRRSDNPNNFA